jgi:hypothetical protein
MKKSVISVLAVPALMLAMLLPASGQATSQPQGGASGQGMQMGKGKKMRGERHPAIRKAIKALERAKDDLQGASHDFGGHREAALDAVNKAMEQLKLALNYDKK